MKTPKFPNRHWRLALLPLLLAGTLVVAQNPPSAAVGTAAAPAANPAPPPAAPAQRSAADLEKLVMPIALHPDPLIAIILPASVYPVEIVQAARFVKDTNNIPKVDAQPWDENVKAVAKFPALIAKMDTDLAWTTDLGQAFLDQPKDLMDSIQALRAKAQKAGTLRTSEQQIVVVTNEVVNTTIEQQVVVVTNTIVQIVPSNPEVVYVPTYPPTVYYPPPAYVYDPYAPLVTFGVGIAVGAIIANNCDWHGGGVYVGHHGVAVWGGGDYNGGHNTKIKVEGDVNINSGNRVNSGNRPTQNQGQKWQPDQNRLRSSGAPGAANSARTAEARGWSSGAAGGARPSTQPAGGARPTPSTGAARPSTGGAAPRPSTGAANTRPSPGAPAARPSAAPSSASRPASRPSTSQGSAFGGVSSGNAARASSNRGISSRSGGFGGGGGRTGGGRR